MQVPSATPPPVDSPQWVSAAERPLVGADGRRTLLGRGTRTAGQSGVRGTRTEGQSGGRGEQEGRRTDRARGTVCRRRPAELPRRPQLHNCPPDCPNFACRRSAGRRLRSRLPVSVLLSPRPPVAPARAALWGGGGGQESRRARFDGAAGAGGTRTFPGDAAQTVPRFRACLGLITDIWHGGGATQAGVIGT